MSTRFAHATLTTATVDVRVLRIGAKQMTLAVFKQLERDDHVTGSMWGRINYCHKDFGGYCSGKADDRHCHVVWQANDELRHATVALAPVRITNHRSWAFDLMRDMTGNNYTVNQPLYNRLLTLQNDHLAWIDRDKNWSSMPSDERKTHIANVLALSDGGWSDDEEHRLDEPILSLPQLFIAV